MSNISRRPALALVPKDPRTLWRRYAIALLAIAAIAGVVYAVNTTTARIQREIAIAINISGKQRMLSQRIAFYAGRASTAPAATSEAERSIANDRLNAAIALFEKHHEGLLNGSKALGLNVTLSDRLEAIYFGETDLDARSRTYARLAQSVVNASEREMRPAYDALLALDPDALLRDLDRAVSAFEELAHLQEHQSVAMERASLLAVLAIILLEAIFIFVPAHLSIKRGIRQIVEKSEENTTLAQERKEAENANSAKSVFLANMSHELRTPLNGVLGMAQLLGETPLNDVQRKYNNTILSCGRSLLALINDVLDISKIEAGKFELAQAEFDLETVINEAIDTVVAPATQKQLDLNVEIDPTLTGLYDSDAVRLRQALINLLGNAVKFTNEGSVTLKVTPGKVAQGTSRAEVDGERRVLRFAVVDTGPGIAPDQKEAIFERFAQADAGMRQGASSTGLGLAITAVIAKQLGGSVGVDSALGEGSTFWIEADLMIAKEVSMPSNDCSAIRANSGGAFRVLIADDVEVNLMVAATALESQDCVVHKAANGVDVLEALAVLAFDVVILDLHMPKMDGEQTIRAIRESAADYKDIPIIVSSADALAEARARSIAAGANAFVAKPYNIATLKDEIRAVVVNADATAPLTAAAC